MKHFILFVFVTTNLVIQSQNRIITGTVKDFNSKANLEYCNVYLINSTIGTHTDYKGKFKLEIPIAIDVSKLIISTLSYITDTILIIDNINDYFIFLNPTEEILSEVVVTGVSKATLIKENPVSIISISQKAIEQTIESNIIDVLAKNAPGLNAVKTGPNISKPFIRGLGYNRVLTLYDGLRQEGQQWGDEHGIEVDGYNIDKAEVVKGPASLTYGSDALAGVVSLFSFIPNDLDGKIHGKFISEYQTNNNLIGNGLRLNYSNKHVLFAISGSYRIAKNYQNTIDGRVYNSGFEEKNVSLLVGYKSDKGFSHFNFTLYDNLQGIPDGSRDSVTRKFTKQIFEGSNDDVKSRPIVSEQELNSYILSPLNQHIKHYRVYCHNSYKVGKGDIDFSLGVQQNIRREYNHPTFPKQPGMGVKLNTLNYGLRYNTPTFKNIETTIGINGMFQNNNNENATDFPIPNYKLFDGGVYFHSKWKYNKWIVSGGIRYDIRGVEWNDFYVRTNSITGFDEHINSSDTGSATLQFPAYKKKFNGVSASFGSTFQVTKHIGIKVNISRGYRAPNITEIASNGLDPGAHIIYLGNRKFNPEFSLQQDIGTSISFKNISAELSLFNNTIQNYIYLTMLVDGNGNPITDIQGNKTYQYQQASAQLYGMEASLFIHPEKIKGFSFDNSFSVVNGFNRKPEYKNEGINGEFLSLIPPLKLLSGLSQKIQTKLNILKTITPKFEVEFNATQNKFLGLNNTETKTLGYTLLNISVSSEIKYSKKQSLQLQFQINNLLDKAYQSNLNRLKYFEYYTQSPKGPLGIYNMGRNMCLKLILTF